MRAALQSANERYLLCRSTAGTSGPCAGYEAAVVLLGWAALNKTCLCLTCFQLLRLCRLLTHGQYFIMGLAVVLAECLLAAVLALLAWTAFFSPLGRIPGPFLARFTNLWRFFDVYRHASDKTQLRLHRQHGPYVRLGPNFISVADPALVPTIYGSRDPLRKSDFYAAGDSMKDGIRSSSQFSTRR